MDHEFLPSGSSAVSFCWQGEQKEQGCSILLLDFCLITKWVIWNDNDACLFKPNFQGELEEK